MSSETLLSGELTMKVGVSYEEAAKLVKEIADYTEVRRIYREGEIITYEEYLKIKDDIPWNGTAVIVRGDTFDDSRFLIKYQNLSWMSHLHVTFGDLKEAVRAHEGMLEEGYLSLYILPNSPDDLYEMGTK